MNGFFNIYKEKGFTSFDVCNKIKYMMKERKVGHTGTLDPNAVGVMQIAVGKATKLLPLLEDHIKVYEPTIKFGILTDSLDPDGKILETSEVPNITLKDIEDKLEKLSSITEQIPPIFSAIKVNGKKLYEYARNGQEVEIKPRPVKIFETMISSDFFMEDNHLCIKIKLKVSKGFYVRSFVRDLANELGTIAIMSDLTRLQTGDFEINNSKKLSEISENDLISVEDVFSYLPRFDCKEYLVRLIKNGIELDERQMTCDSPFSVYYNNKLLAIYEPSNNKKYKLVQYFGE